MFVILRSSYMSQCDRDTFHSPLNKRLCLLRVLIGRESVSPIPQVLGFGGVATAWLYERQQPSTWVELGSWAESSMATNPHQIL